MAPNPQCAALATAMNNKGISYAQVASGIGKSEQHIINICTGVVQPTQQEFDGIASFLGIKSSAPHTAAHTTR